MAITQEKQKRREIKVTGVLTRKIANLHQKRCLQQADSNTRPPRNYVTKKPWTSDLARVTLRQQKGEKEEEERRTKHNQVLDALNQTDQILINSKVYDPPCDQNRN